MSQFVATLYLEQKRKAACAIVLCSAYEIALIQEKLCSCAMLAFFYIANQNREDRTA